MAQTPEGRLKAAVKKELKRRGVWYFMPMQNGMGVVGIPDFICCAQGWFFAIETKAPGKLTQTPGMVVRRGPVGEMPVAVTANQRNVIGCIRDAGGTAIAVDNLQQVIDVLDHLQARRRRLSYLVRVARRALKLLYRHRRQHDKVEEPPSKA